MGLTNWEQTMPIASRAAHLARHAMIDRSDHLALGSRNRGIQPWI